MFIDIVITIWDYYIHLEVDILETIALDSKTLVIKTDNENDLPEIIGYINLKNKNIDSFFSFALKNRVNAKNYKFNREACYNR